MSALTDRRVPVRRGSCLLVVAVAAAVLAQAVSSASTLPIDTNPTWSPDGSEVAFAYAGNSNYRIVAAPASGAGPIRTVYSAKNVGGCCDPMLWSATGGILFDSNFSLTSVRPTGGKATVLASDGGRLNWFLLSPNGATAAFDGPDGHSPAGVGLVNVVGGKPLMVPRPPNAGDALDGFSPDGTDLIFSRVPFVNGEFGSSSTFMVEHVGGGTPVPLSRSGLIGASRLPAGALSPEWSPDGRWIAYYDNGKLEIVGTTGAAAAPRTLAGWIEDGFSWSPTSKLIACFCGPNREHVRFTTINPQGTERTILWASRSLHYLSEVSRDLPQWSPDGSKLAFLARAGPGYPLQVWIVGSDGTGLKRVA